MGQTIVEKIAQRHLAAGPSRPLRAGDMVSLRPTRILTHDNSSAVLKKFRALGGTRVHDASQPVFALDHEIQNTSPENQAKYAEIEAFARAQGIVFHGAGEGIGHQLMVANGFVLPGTLVVASDSHANTYGALGALGTPVVRTDAAAVWATGEFWWQIPATVLVRLEGRLRPGVSGKDVILTLCGTYNHDEVLNVALEFTGPGVLSLGMAERLTIANMTTEWGALTGWFPVDAVTTGYLEERYEARLAHGAPRFTAAQLAEWREHPPLPDADAAYAARITLDLAAVQPCVAGPDAVQRVQPLEAVRQQRVRIDRAYLLSCVNGREHDLEAAAAALEGRPVAPGVKLYVAAASREVQERVAASGAWQQLLNAGAIALPPGCGPCIGLGEGLLEPGEVGISATNRNFKGRMGSRDATVYLGNPEVVARSAVAGYIDGPARPGDGPWPPARRGGESAPERSRPEAARPEQLAPAAFERVPVSPPARETVAILPGFPATLEGRLLFLPQNDLNTDGIYGKDYTYRELPRAEMARVVMANYDPQFAPLVQPGDIVVSGWNFGTGSSREQAVTALQAAGVSAVVVGSASQTYLRNAFNNGFICIECPALVNALQARYAAAIARGEPTIVAELPLALDFALGLARFGSDEFAFPALGEVPQALVAAGGIEQLVRKKLSGER
jgi:homoaconitate hydratase